MAIDQLKGAAGVQIKTVDLSARPAGTANKYRIGLVGWTPKGPSNKVTLITNLTDLYSLFGYPTGYPVHAVFALHNAKILLDAGADVQLVRAVDGGFDSATNKPVTELLNYGAFDVASTASLKSPAANVSNISGNMGSDGKSSGYTLVPADAASSPFTAFIAYPGFDGYQLQIQTFEYANVVAGTGLYAGASGAFASDGKSASAGDVFAGDVAHSLNVFPGSGHVSSDRVAFKSYVTGLGLYNDYNLVNQGSESTPVMYGDVFNALDGKFYTTNGVLKSAWDTALGGTQEELLAVAGVKVNSDLNDLLAQFVIIRLFASSTATTPLETIYATINDYVTSNGVQLGIEYATSNLLLFRANSEEYEALVNPLYSSTIKGSCVNRTILGSGSILKFTGVTPPKGTVTIGQTSRNCFANAWNLFKDVTTVDVSLLVDGGSSINDFGNDRDNIGMESGDINLVKKMLEVSSYRMDAPSIIDLPKKSSASDLVKYFVRNYPSMGSEVGGSTAPFASYWGNAQDGRQLINDTYNRKQIECARSVFKAVVAYNVFTNSVPWQTQWGPNRGLITSPSIASLNVRAFPDDVGLLCQNRINPSKNTAAGEFFWDDYTMMAKSSILQRWHAVCFLANLNKRYRTILEQYVAELNTPALRKTIFNVLNEDLNYIMNVASPQGLYNYYVICDESNNTPAVIDAGELNVDIGLEIARDTRVINLTTTLYRTGGIVESGIKLN